jgi:hypothetical protein
MRFLRITKCEALQQLIARKKEMRPAATGRLAFNIARGAADPPALEQRKTRPRRSSTISLNLGIFSIVKSLALVLFLALAFSGSGLAQSTDIEIGADAKLYGEYPKNYKEIILKWLETKLADPASANIEWTTEPKPADLPGPDGKRLYGYLVEFKVAARNRFGAYTGKQKHGALIKDGNVIKGTGFGF